MQLLPSTRLRYEITGPRKLCAVPGKSNLLGKFPFRGADKGLGNVPKLLKRCKAKVDLRVRASILTRMEGSVRKPSSLAHLHLSVHSLQLITQRFSGLTGRARTDGVPQWISCGKMDERKGERGKGNGAEEG